MDMSCNQSVIVGELVQLPEVRDLPSGASLVSFSLTVRADGQRTTSVPLTWFDPPDKIHRWEEGDVILAMGSVVRRFYQAGGGTGSRTDVDVRRAESLSHRGRSKQVVHRARRVLDELAGALNTD